MRRLFLVILILTVMLPLGRMDAQAQQPPKYELRGAWIATVYGLDWPSVKGYENLQKNEMRRLLNSLKDAGINAIFFQVRARGDAMYKSRYEPWSYYLTGSQNTPSTYDPLAIFIEEAHRRGMELHAWLNPYWLHGGESYTLANNHVAVSHPEWTYQTGNYTYLDPGQQAVRDYVSTIVMDIARRYDIDGIHFDDYFYPYPPNQIWQEDIATFQRENRGFTSLAAWRRDNVNLQVQQVSDSLHAFDPQLKFGISPFGIWKNGVPSGIRGLDAYAVIYADPLAWIKAKTVDYLTPQLYWAFGGGQDYGRLASWWAGQIEDRHLYMGHALYKVDQAQFSASEVINQVGYNRSLPEILGSVFFRASHLKSGRSRNFSQVMRGGYYAFPALPPPMPWKDMSALSAPTNLKVVDQQDAVLLTWDPPLDAEGRYAVYRVKSDVEPNASLAAGDARNLIALTGEPQFRAESNADPGSYWYFVQSVSRNSIESPPSNLVRLSVQTALEQSLPSEQLEMEIYPSVVQEQVQVEYSLRQPSLVTLQIFDSLGRSVSILAEGEFRQPGSYFVSVSAVQHLHSSGVYWLVLSTDRERIAKSMIYLR